MSTQNKLLFIPLYEEFVNSNRLNKRRLSTGRKITERSKENYLYLLRLLKEFEKHKSCKLRFTQLTKDRNLFLREKRYHERFYIQFTDYLFDTLDLYDNYVGHNIRKLRAFYNWVNTDKGYKIGMFHKRFHIWTEDPPIIALSANQVRRLLFDAGLRNGLSKTEKRVIDIFVFGCTVGLRYGDIRLLTRDNLEEHEYWTYLVVRSQKTQTVTKIKLPRHALGLINKYRLRSDKLFDCPSTAHFNKKIKEVALKAGWTQMMPKYRNKRGQPILQYANDTCKTHYRFCDLISSHTMRRTAITTLLNQGVDEEITRRISGHSAGSKAFYRYVEQRQIRIDLQTDKAFEQIFLND